MTYLPHLMKVWLYITFGVQDWDPVNTGIMKWLPPTSKSALSIYLPFYVWCEHLRFAVLAHCTVQQGIRYSHMREMSWMCSPEVKAYRPGLWRHNSLSASVNALLSEILCLPFGVGVFSVTRYPPGSFLLHPAGLPVCLHMLSAILGLRTQTERWLCKGQEPGLVRQVLSFLFSNK